MSVPIVITGASTGIGAAIRDRLQGQAHVLVNLDVATPQADPHDFVACDLNEPERIEQAIDHLPTQLAGLICVAGVGPSVQAPERVMRINFLGTRHLVERLMPRIQPGGAVTLVASSAGRDWRDNRAMVDAVLATADFDAGLQWLQEQRPRWADDAYKFSKQCLAAYTYLAAGHALARGLRVNCINPGITQTRLSDDFRDMLGHDAYDRITRLTGRAGRPQDIAGVAEFLTVGDSQWINGVEITVDGGYFAGVVAGWHPE